MESTVSVDETFWTRPALGFRVVEPKWRSKIARLKERTGKLFDRPGSTITRLHLPSVQKLETLILFSETLLLDLERRGIAFSLPGEFVRRQEGKHRFYYYAAPDTQVRFAGWENFASEKDMRLQRKQAVLLSRFEATAADLFHAMMSEPAEPGVTPELRMKELNTLMRSVDDERFTKDGSYVLDAVITTLCGLDIDSAFRTEWFEAKITEVINKNGWVNQF